MMLRDDGTSLVWRSIGLLVVSTAAREILRPVKHHVREVKGEEQMLERLADPAMRVRGVAAMAAISVAAAGEGVLRPTTQGVLLGVGSSIFATMLTDILPVSR